MLSLENFGKTLRKVHFCITIMARKSIKDYLIKLKNSAESFQNSDQISGQIEINGR